MTRAPLACLAAVLAALALSAASCERGRPEPDPPAEPGRSLLSVDYAPTAYDFALPEHFPAMPQPADNSATAEGVRLGQRLFFDPILSRDSSFSCASCHRPELAFTDGEALSRGIDGLRTRRSSMSLVNVGFQREFFWDGRAGSLEEQSLHPVEDPIELDASWPEVEARLRAHPDYPEAFRAAFGIERSTGVTRELVARAIAQFERSLVSATSRFDRAVYGLDGFLSDLEEDGRVLFFTEPSTEHPGCAHCHNAPTFADLDAGGTGFRNNGLDAVDELDGFADAGRGAVTGNLYDNGKFRAPTLRNVELTAPYMHDGRFATLDEVLDHYASGGHYSPTRDVQMTGFTLSDGDREALKAFLRTLTDPEALRREGVVDPG